MLIQYNEPRSFQIDLDFRLIAGVNEVQQGVWDKYKKHPVVKAKLEKGIFEIVDEPKKAAGKKVIEGLAAHGLKQAKEVIKKTYSLETLDSWLNSETRNSVIKVIQDQIVMIQDNPKEEKKG